MIKDNKTIMNNSSMKLFFMLSLYFLSVLVLYTITSLLNINNVLGFIEIISVLIPIIYIISKEKRYLLIIIYLFLVVCLPFLSGKTLDLTIDGNTYHKTAIGFIKNGWNPYRESIMDYQKTNNNVVEISKKSRLNLWVEHYPKAAWVIAATMYQLTGNIESGKAVSIILSIMLIILSYNLLRKILDKKWTIIITILLSLSPVLLSQAFSYYVDGILGICFVIQLMLLFMINPTKKQNSMLWISLISIISILSNLKFTGLMVSGIISIIFYLYWLIKYKEKSFKNITGLCILVYVISIFLIGSNSYIKNLVDHHNPLYPIIGSNKIDIITTMEPKSFNNKNNLEKFTISLFSKTKNVTYGKGEPELKVPYKMSKTEKDELVIPDVRIGGFGPMFAFGMLLSIIIFIIGFIILLIHDRKSIKYIIITLLSGIIPIALVGESWWARYIPWFYYLIIGNIIVGVYASKYLKKKKLLQLITLLPVLVLLYNGYIFTEVLIDELDSFRLVKTDLNEMKYTDNLKIKLTNPDTYGYLYTLKDKGIKYNLVNEIDKDKLRYRYCYRFEEEKDE